MTRLSHEQQTAGAARSRSRVRARTATVAARVLSTALRWHALVFALINGFLAAINLATTPSYLWFLWVIGAWGMGLVLHAFAVFSSTGSTSSADAADEQPLPIAAPAPAVSLPPPSAASDASTQLRTDVGSAPTRLSERAPAGASLLPGQRVGERFVIERVLGAGGMGEVYLARDSVLDERVALKTVAASQLGPSALERFRREAQAARRITHPHVVRIHDIGQDGALCFISMEYIEGETLRQHVHRTGPLAGAEGQRIALQLCDAVEAAHAAGVIHRDLKPDNILIDRQGQVRVIDFGLARLEEKDGLTATGTVLGTPDYMAPEQLLGHPADARTDIYAMGCVLYYLVTGAPPFERASVMAVGLAHCQDAPKSLVESRVDLAKSWDALILRALEKSADRRFQSARELRAAISAVRA